MVWRYGIVPWCIIETGFDIVNDAMRYEKSSQSIELTQKGVSSVEEYLVQEIFRKEIGCIEASCRNLIWYIVGDGDGPVISNTHDRTAHTVAEVGSRVLEGALSLVTFYNMATTRGMLHSGK